MPLPAGHGAQGIVSDRTARAVVLSEFLGLSIAGAVCWAALTGATGNSYAAAAARRATTPRN